MPSVVSRSIVQPERKPATPGSSSTTYRFQVPLGSVPSKTERAVFAPADDGAGAG